MDSNKISNWLQVAGNFGLLAGLLVVGYQLYQDRQLKRAELIFASFETNQDRAFTLMGERPHEAIVRAAYKPDETTAEDAYVVALALETYLRSLDRSAVMEDLGVFTGGWREGERPGLAYEFGTEVGQQYLRERLPNLSVSEEVKEKLLNKLTTTITLKDRIEGWRGKVEGTQ